MRTNRPGETPSTPVTPVTHAMLAKLLARRHAHSAPGGLGDYPLRTARARHRTGVPAHVKEFRERADALLVERATECGAQENPRVRLAWLHRDWTWARRLLVAEIDRRAHIAAGKVPF